MFAIPSPSNDPHAAQPSTEMEQHFLARTANHIAKVSQNLHSVALHPDYRDVRDVLHERARLHDQSKFQEPERTPYIWLTERYRCHGLGIPFAYPDGMQEQVRAAIQHHVTSNAHHPESHSSLDAMSEIDIVEMVCDWTAMAQEKGEGGGSARGWADKSIGVRWSFSAPKRDLIYKIISILEDSAE